MLPVKFGLGGVPLGNEFEIVSDEDAYKTLEAAWNAFEDAAIVPGDGATTTGVFTGVSHNAYADVNLASHPDLSLEAAAMEAESTTSSVIALNTGSSGRARCRADR